MNNEMSSLGTQKAEGPFVLLTLVGEGFIFDERHEIVRINGRPKQIGVKRNYFESDLGEGKAGNDSNLLIVFYVQIMPDDFVMLLHRF
ncbi:hypothetical protein A1WY_01200 [Escherichia coli KTE111]|nr:hypothetical protein A1WY_01200 [Escherichia coli KTE111]